MKPPFMPQGWGPGHRDENPLAAELDRIVVLAERDWRSLTGARILLTGGTGFFGTWIVEAFVRANRLYRLGARLHVLSRNPAAFLRKFPHLATEPSLEFPSGDIRAIPWPSGGCTHVLHAATATSGPVAMGDPEETYSVITEGTHHVLRLCREHGVKRCLLVTSGAVYGRQPSGITHVPETFHGGPDQTSPAAAYGEGKRAAELLAGIYSQRYGVETPIARCFAFVGPHLPLDVHFAVGNFIRDVLEGRTVAIKGDGTPRRSYLHPSDLVIWLLAILVRGQGGRAYNVGSEDDRSIREMAEAVVRAGAELWPDRPACDIVVAGSPQPGASIERYVPSCERARSELDLPEIIPLHEAILSTLRFHTST
jgi:dTDP-glucose 4,6-dehydratase